jgi:ubiquinone/menaquinone biosynthesis C-methylase UbiE
MATFLRIAGLIFMRRLHEWALRRGLPARSAEAELVRQRSAEELEEAREVRARERRWQDEVGCALLDKPYEFPGSRAVFERQADHLIRFLDPHRDGLVIEVGCGKGHFLERLRDASGSLRRRLVGIDISHAVASLHERGIAGVRADGERLPFRDASAAYVIYDGALHHCIDYPRALAEAVRVLEPGGAIVLFEPSTSWFNRAVHHLLDPIVFRNAIVYESPVDIRYKDSFRQSIVVAALRRHGLHVTQSRSDFLAYPFTGCYAGSMLSRSARAMQALIAIEDWFARWPVLSWLANALAWRFTIVATKPVR